MRSKSVKQFCEDHSITKPTFYKEVNVGRIRIFKVGSLTRISDVAEADYISESEKRAAAGAAEASKKAAIIAAGRKLDHSTHAA